MKNIAKATLLCFTLLTITVGCAQRTYIMSFTDADRSGKTVSQRFPPPQAVDGKDQGADYVQAPIINNPKSKPTDQHQNSVVTAENQNIAEDPFVETPSPATTYNHSFAGNETEHIKFSAYDPFSEGADSFTLDLDATADSFTYPINGKFSSGYGRRGRGTHTGVDLVAPAKTPIYAAFDGTVRLSKPYSGYGNVIVIRHTNGLETVYAHNSKNLVSVGQSVRSGEQIAQCGRTGRATTDHLHFEVRVKGQTINPNLLIDPKEKCLQRGVLHISRSSNNGISAKLTVDKNLIANEQPTLAAATTTTSQEQIASSVTSDPMLPDSAQDKAKIPEPASTVTPSAHQSKGIRVGDTIYEAPQADPPKSEAKYHTIASGDTLSEIAQKYKTTVSAICSLNNMGRNDVIRIGKKLRIK